MPFAMSWSSRRLKSCIHESYRCGWERLRTSLKWIVPSTPAISRGSPSSKRAVIVPPRALRI